MLMFRLACTLTVLLLACPVFDSSLGRVLAQTWGCDSLCRERKQWTEVVSSVPTTHLEYEDPDCLYCFGVGHCVRLLGEGGVCRRYEGISNFRTYASGTIRCNTVYVNGWHESILSGPASNWIVIEDFYNCDQ